MKIYQKIVICILSAFVFFGMSLVFAAETEFDFDSEAGIILKYKGKKTEVTIPQSMNGVAVKSIGARAFEGNVTVKKIYFPNQLKTIEASAFKNCKHLKAINNPEYLQKLNPTAFEGCKLLNKTYVSALNDTIRYNINPVNNFIVDKKTGTLVTYCGRNDEVIIPASVGGIKLKKVARTAFYQNEVITSVVMNEGILEVERQSFLKCKSLKRVHFSKNVEVIGLQTFWANDKLEEVILPEALTTIGEQAFAFCPKLKQIDFPQKLEEIGYEAFRNCARLERLVIPESVYEIKSLAFLNCSALSAVTFRGETSIGMEAFGNCEGLTIYSNLTDEYFNFAERNGYKLSKEPLE